MRKGHQMYERSKGKASQASYTRAKEMMKEGKWGLVGSSSTPHPVLLRSQDSSSMAKKLEEEKRRKALLMAVNAFKPAETVLEIGARGNAETAALMKHRRQALDKAARRAQLASTSTAKLEDEDEDSSDEEKPQNEPEVEMADEEEIAAVFDSSSTKDRKGSYRDSEYYMSHYQKNADTEKGYSLRDGASFAEQAKGVTFDLAGDDAVQERKRRELRWDKSKKKFVKGTGEGADNVKLVKTESGIKLPATYRSGRFDEWKAKSRVSLPRVGETESSSGHRSSGPGGRKWKHKQNATPKPLDKLRTDYERKSRQQKKRQGEGEPEPPASKGKGMGKKLGGRFNGKTVGRVKNELKTVDQIRKSRQVAEKRKAKNARPSHRKGRR
ncbi:hypothetical protein NM688_g7217 [Phlebia brevispora]|uniref:Uncharacterized protein n=1 Tax=Phlebia brevispora TaxID=194682 RepID=A0ACC1S7X6_9APHY|nr:hypothetical protein NM688_g7217 [Phlebia brevispora]